MTLIDIKKSLETYFITNYTTTPIHWAGMNFDTTVNSEWVYFEYVGQSIMDSGLDNTKNQHSGQIEISIIAETQFTVHTLASEVMEIFKAKKLDEMFIRTVSILTQGFDTSLGKSYMVIAIDTSNR